MPAPMNLSAVLLLLLLARGLEAVEGEEEGQEEQHWRGHAVAQLGEPAHPPPLYVRRASTMAPVTLDPWHPRNTPAQQLETHLPCALAR